MARASPRNSRPFQNLACSPQEYVFQFWETSSCYWHNSDREEATKEDDFTLNEDYDDQDDEQEEWDRDIAWTNDGDDGEGDVKDESAAYLEFLEEEVGAF